MQMTGNRLLLVQVAVLMCCLYALLQALLCACRVGHLEIMHTQNETVQTGADPFCVLLCVGSSWLRIKRR